MKKNKKTYWPYMIIVAFVAFAAFIFSSVYGSFKSRVDLVSENYYEQEINYQQEINRKENVYKLSAPIQIVSNNGSIQVKVPQDLKSSSGTIELRRNDNPSLDQLIDLEFSSNLVASINTSRFTKGKWNATLLLNKNDTPYQVSEVIFIE